MRKVVALSVVGEAFGGNRLQLLFEFVQIFRAAYFFRIWQAKYEIAEAEVLGAPGAAEPIEAAGESGATGSRGSLPRHRTLKEGWQEFELPHARAAMRSKAQRRTSRL